MALVCAVVAAGRPAGAAEPAPADAEAFFESRVRPLLAERCQSCHGPAKAEAGLRIDSRPALLAGGDGGVVVVPGDAAASRLVAAVRRDGDLAMPPDEPLTAAEVAVLERWVADGLPWSGPGAEATTPATRPDAAARLAASATHWAFTPPRRHEPPQIPAPLPPAFSAWSGSTIDRFVAAGIAAAGIEPAPEAAPRDLVRRLWFDLVGLPPPAVEVDAFCRDPSAAAYAALVERLLATPEHAEHWARKWLDLARYADTAGYALDGQDARYPHAWTYRDWVVRALHDDLPYDRFVTLQLAADLLAPPVPPADLAALGFLTVGRSFIGNQHDIIDDRIDLVTRGLMGLTVACARCHDHLYEPVSMADYYALHGIFANSRTPDPLPTIGPPPPGTEAEAFARRHAELAALIPAHEAAVHARAAREAIAHAADYFFEVLRPAPRGDDKRPPRLADGYELEQLLLDRLARALAATPTDPVLGPWAALAASSDAEFAAAVPQALAAWLAAGPNAALRRELEQAPPATARQLADAYGRLVVRAAAADGAADDAAELAALRARFTTPGAPFVVLPSEALRVANRDEQTKSRKLRRDLTAHEAEAAGGPPRAMALEDVPEPADSRILLRGNAARPGDVVPRRMPAVLGGAAVPGAASGRLELARCIVDPRNPLTARVIVNWVWLHHFGAGLVPTPGDLGLRGAAPTHPELLDDLASRFVAEGGWSLRWLHREIVTSRTWRQSAAVRPEVAAADPDNLLLARATRRRLDWEAWRDALLAAAGTLDPARRGGRGVDPLAPAALHARSLYASVDRQDVPGLLRVFDVADPDVAVHARSRTSVPQRALAMLNAPLVVEAARRLAERATDDAADDAAFVERLWRLTLSRDPDGAERAAGLAFLAEAEPAQAVAAQAPFGPRARLAQALLASAEFEFID